MADSTSSTAAGTCRTVRPSSLAASTLSGKVSAGYTDGQRRTAPSSKGWHSSSKPSTLEVPRSVNWRREQARREHRNTAHETQERKAANKMLQLLPVYADGLQLEAMNAVLQEHGFSELEPGIYCGRRSEE